MYTFGICSFQGGGHWPPHLAMSAPSVPLSLSLSHSLQDTGCRFYNSFLHIQPPYLVRFLWNLLSLCYVLYWIEIYSLLMCSIWETNKTGTNTVCLIMKIDKVVFEIKSWTPLHTHTHTHTHTHQRSSLLTPRSSFPLSTLLGLTIKLGGLISRNPRMSSILVF